MQDRRERGKGNKEEKRKKRGNERKEGEGKGHGPKQIFCMCKTSSTRPGWGLVIRVGSPRPKARAGTLSSRIVSAPGAKKRDSQ